MRHDTLTEPAQRVTVGAGHATAGSLGDRTRDAFARCARLTS